MIFLLSVQQSLISNQEDGAHAELFAPDIAGVNINAIWNKSWGWVKSDRGYGVWVNGSNIYTCGYTNSMGSGAQDMLLVKWDENGNKIWNRTWGGSWDDDAQGLGGNGTHIFTCGKYSTSASDYVLALVAWDSNGNVAWSRTYVAKWAQGMSIFVNGSYVYTCGMEYSLTGNKDDFLLIKWDMGGNLVWDKRWGGVDEDFGRSVFVNGSAIYTCGYCRSFGSGNYDTALVKWDANGNVLWNKTWGGGDVDIGLDVCVNGSAIYTGGTTHSYGAGTGDVCVIKWDQNGNILWNRSWGGSESEECFSICTLGPNIYTCGDTIVNSKGNYLCTVWDVNGNLLDASNWGLLDDAELGWDIIGNGSFLYACGFLYNSSVNMMEDLVVLKLAPEITPDPPAVSIYSPTPGMWYQAGQEVLCNVTDRSGTGLASVKYLWSTSTVPPDWTTQGDPWLLEPYSTTIPTGLVGFIHLHVNATDNAGLSTANYFTFRRDGDNPSVVLNTPSQGGPYAPETVIDCSVSDGSGVGLANVLYNWSTSITQPDWEVDGVAWFSPYNVQIPYGPSGNIYLHVNATDLLNNQNCTYFTFLRDGASPIIALDNATENAWYAPGTVIDCRVTPQGGASVASVKYSWTATTTTPNWAVDGTSWSEPYYALIAVGTTALLYLHINATDTFGNNISSYFSFRRDGEVPSIVLNSPPENTEIASGATVDCSISDSVGSGLALVKMLWSSSSTPPSWNTGGSEWTSTYDTTVPAGMTGQVYLHVYAIDAAGNSYSTSFAFKIRSSESGIPGIQFMELISFSILGVIFVALRRFRNKN